MNFARFVCTALLFYPPGVNSEPFSVLAGAVVVTSASLFWGLRDTIRCKMYECCDDLKFNPYQLEYDLQTKVFGQHLVKDTVVNALKSHWSNDKAKKPLVLSFHGYTGSGKNYVAEIIANNTYRDGMYSPFVHHIVATLDYPDKSMIEMYQVALRKRVIDTVKKCKRSLFIFDETDKLPEKLLAVLKPFLDYYNAVSGADFRQSVFIFLSNKGGAAIADQTVNHHEHGLSRETLQAASFERILMSYSYNEEGGLKMSELISNHLIDHFIPFLPLQREHVKKCIEVHLRHIGRQDLIDNIDVTDDILNSLQYFPEHSKAFSSSGCKRVDAKTDLEASKNRRPTAAVFTHDDEF